MIEFKDVSLLSWNIWGANNVKSKRHLMELIRKYKPTILVIMETRVPFEKTRNFWNKTEYVKVDLWEAQGHSGGLWIMKHNGCNLNITILDRYTNTITMKLTKGNSYWNCTCLYASPTPTMRPALWNHLSSLAQTIQGTWLMVGDFNDIISPNEQRGGIYYHSRAVAMLQMMSNCDMLDLPTTGGKFTWHRNCTGQRRVAKKLDRCTANLDWRLQFPEAFVEVLYRSRSDHNPILLRCGGLPQTQGNRPFRFEAAWITHPDYHSIVENAWHRGNHDLVQSLNYTQGDSMIFNRETFGNIFRRKNTLERRLKGIQNSLERIDSIRLVLLEKELQREYDNILFQEEIHWYQKSRERWITLGDKNTKFFHAQTVIRRKRNRIHGLHLPSGSWCTDDSVLQDEAVKYFKSLFCAPSSSRPTRPQDHRGPRLSDAAFNDLTAPVTMEEVSTALNHMHPYKSPGPDGFQGVFFRQFWPVVCDDIHRLIATAFTTGHFDPSLSATLIALIPKVDSPSTFKDFRPISLCNTIYKLITKVMVNRLRPHLDHIIGPFQSSFLPGRGTSDNAIVLQEVVHSMHRSKKKKGDVVYKIDLEKAYDHISWEFLKSCLDDFGFPPIIVKLIMHCVTSSNLAIIWNGNRLPAFSPTRGLRQGDPLSPYLFVICMEKLSHAISEAVDANRWKPVQISRTGPSLSHLFFADDVLIFSKATGAQAKLIADIFSAFGDASGLRVNLQKSRAFYSSGVSRHTRDQITNITTIRSTPSLDKYLGFPMLKGRVKHADYDFLIDKLQTRLAAWKNKLLNKAGRITLAKSVLNSIPTYYMQTAWLPQSICDQIDRTTRDFIWQGNNDKGIHCVGWNTITRSKNLGGLGIRRAREANTALLGKLVSDVHHHKEKLWVNLISAKYITDEGFLFTPKTAGSPIWNAISKARLALQDGYIFRIGNGASSIWYSPWSPLGKVSALIPYVDIHDIDLTLRDLVVNNEWNFDALFTSIPENCKEYLSSMLPLINNDVVDCFTWSGQVDGTYTAKSGYAWLMRQHLGPNSVTTDHSWSWIWKDYGPEKIKVMVWSACHDSLPTAAMLNHRNLLPHPSCSRCNGPMESILHILRDCPLSADLWRSFGFVEQSFYANQDIVSWLQLGVTGANSSLFISGIWWNWRARNSIVLANEAFPLFRLRMEVSNLAGNISLYNFTSNMQATRTTRWISWHPSRDNCLVLNVDGSCLGNPGAAGMGGVLRTTNGDWLVGFSGHLGHKDILFAELMAMYKGLLLAWDHDYSHVACYSDSLLAIQLVQSPLNQLHAYATVIQNIKDCIRRNWTVQIHHTLREGNSAADFMAKLGANSSDRWSVFHHPPHGIADILSRDAARLLVPRF